MKPPSCPYFVAAKAVKSDFQEKELLHFFDQTTQLLTARFCVATIRGRHLKPTDASMMAGKGMYERYSDDG